MTTTTPGSTLPLLAPDLTVTSIFVGTEPRYFTVHKNLLCHYSNYFRAAYDSGMKEAHEHRFVLTDDVDPAAVSTLITWMYTGMIPLSLGSEYDGSDEEYVEGDDHSDTTDSDAGDEPNSEMTPEEEEFYIAINNNLRDRHSSLELALPDRWEVMRQHWHGQEVLELDDGDDSNGKSLPKMQGNEYGFWSSMHQGRPEQHYFLAVDPYATEGTEATDQSVHPGGPLANNPSALPSFATVITAFENLPSTSKLRLWMVHVFAYEWDPEMDSPKEVALRDFLPKEFLLEMALVNARRLPRRLSGETALLDADLCYFHDHVTHDQMVQCRTKRGVIVGEEDDEEEDDDDDVDVEGGDGESSEESGDEEDIAMDGA
ncbi:hypothetical protein M409DRAFT_19374 [Zasmidium cellare ATCC 36951]|uniref:BTB domain-containing protein n=1 Tax=Zasmidium cellare ATCC 36951 TaxID=1080233 RepID=A0A6A6CU35_ZASCE|nr:uncharacterized protein M409DRAFT_19374 [Zasmidium cellare ATCC 36951]KAF2170555.1 hypothetical protein M409DRAFT_19374 [Zasmidium cellare ATCC 36951]